MNPKLSEHFFLLEFLVSDTAARRGIDNTPSDEVIANLRRVASKLEEIRALTKRPIVVTSGYRSLALNRAVGGSKTSAHVQGLAADIHCQPFTPFELGQMLIDAKIDFDQLIQEGTWLHVGLAAAGKKPRRQLLTAVFGKEGTTYKEGCFEK
ncbi:D-Ala-D-Ala carboxypeptidase family metallohydrolase [Cupriavidus campinensis]|uniref:Peptidase M15 n=1 Tax=Cupriavidus campinensis TaxID=151783 RepID=A0ABY3ETA4_9BURK|nr:D-Ala-D-Ala carboxypeptidase family metallohydrolase [Cupriavidus campinensis]TSP13968.1 peptidase M15 [Cupriavidus campinensis]